MYKSVKKKERKTHIRNIFDKQKKKKAQKKRKKCISRKKEH